MNLEEAKQKIQDVKIKLHRGADYYQCKAEAEEALRVLNNAGKEIAKKYGKKFKPFTFTGIMR